MLNAFMVTELFVVFPDQQSMDIYPGPPGCRTLGEAEFPDKQE